MQELFGFRPQPSLSDNYLPSVDYPPESYALIAERDLRFRGKNYYAANDGFAGFITFGEVVLLASMAITKDKRKRSKLRSELTRRARRTLGNAAASLRMSA